ncbi:dihydrofolate reductase family protein [Hoyosella rhizosphaerae]|uniref:Deaminase reductase n=1 Tax=Hoyosella rhizosphaerae TaxID=1755582 RepID=A0A916U091_9ACTN|nr:dihydrofolate reductase family protein [Hoyosella rhizosphaerae]MBN4927092.1 dihydrofolate reductase family protein [Hoyosella rhizosphaerae]GGC54116.1 deaminase reductase [Hoyosella rhizosphaerae]
MGQLHVNMTVTLDGVIQANGGPTAQDGNFEFAGWERPFGDPESGERLVADIEGADALLLGRTTYDIFRSYWPGKANPIALAFNRVPKYVASAGVPELSWDNSIQISDVATQVPELCERHRRVHTWGSGNLLQSLFREGLVDRINLWVCPVVLGQGKRLFPEGTTAARFELVEPPKSFSRGVLLLRYQRLEGPPRTEYMSCSSTPV